MDEKELEYLKNLIKNLKSNDSDSIENEFNIFKTLGVENKEVIVCRFLGELLNPQGNHGMESKPLELFFKMVLMPDKPVPEELNNAEVVLEDHIKGDRRVDIVIKDVKSTQEIYPIEVKIGAGDQPSQLYDYFHYYFGEDYEKRIYYLTPTGWEPSDESQKDLKGRNCVEKLSFKPTIRNWLSQLIEQEGPKGPEEQKEKNGFLFMMIKQFIEVIDEMSEIDDYRVVLGIGEEMPQINDENFNEADFKNLKAVFKMLRHSDTLMKYIRQTHLLQCLQRVKDFEYEGCLGDDIDSHALVKIYKKGRSAPVAWVCVDTNIYLCCRKKLPNMGEGKNHLQGKDDYYWQYISPEGIGRTFNMKDYSKELNKEIEIERLLKEIDCT